jgi:hypothetical protein
MAALPVTHWYASRWLIMPHKPGPLNAAHRHTPHHRVNEKGWSPRASTAPGSR